MKGTLNGEETGWTVARIEEIVNSYKNFVVKSEGKGPPQSRMNMWVNKIKCIKNNQGLIDMCRIYLAQ